MAQLPRHRDPQGFHPAAVCGAGGEVRGAGAAEARQPLCMDRPSARRQDVRHGRHVHGCGCVPVRADRLGQGRLDALGVQRGYRPEPVCASAGVVRARAGTAGGAGGAGGGRPVAVARGDGDGDGDCDGRGYGASSRRTAAVSRYRGAATQQNAAL
ncbi:hypothetical protein EMIT0111MI5_180068 [Burkholderia sp. IT-111MI5]